MPVPSPGLIPPTILKISNPLPLRYLLRRGLRYNDGPSAPAAYAHGAPADVRRQIHAVLNGALPRLTEHALGIARDRG